MQSKPLVSIITVCYNSERYIEDTIESVLNQTYSNIEYVVVDGNSEDNTLKIVKEYEPKFEGRMYLISEPDEGIYDAMNKGIKMSHGEILGILNSDDWYTQKAVEKAVEQFKEEDEVDIIHGMMARCNSEGKIDSIYGERSSILNFIDKAPFNHPTCFVKSSVYRNLGLFSTEYKTASDYDFMLKAYQNQSITTKYIPELLVCFRMVGVTSTSSFPARDIFHILRGQNFNIFLSSLGILIRSLRVFTKKILRFLGFDQAIKWYRKIVTHHEDIENFN